MAKFPPFLDPNGHNTMRKNSTVVLATAPSIPLLNSDPITSPAEPARCGSTRETKKLSSPVPSQADSGEAKMAAQAGNPSTNMKFL